MALDTFMIFTPLGGEAPRSDGAVNLGTSSLKAIDPFPDLSPTRTLGAANLFEVRDWSLGVEQTVALGSTSTGSGAGKLAVEPVSFTRVMDSLSPTLLTMIANGRTFKYIDLLLCRSLGDGSRVGAVAYRFGLCAFTHLEWSHDEEVPVEKVTFDYGAIGSAVTRVDPKGVATWVKGAGWNRVKNIGWDPATDATFG